MPNHITTEVEISAPKDKIDALIKKTKIKLDTDVENNEFDFNGILPMPKHSDTFFAEGGLGSDEKEKYGKNNWYDWSIENWGTKWNAYDVRFTGHSDEKLVLQIDTAWDTPRGIWKALEKQGYTVKGVMYGEMEGYDYIGDGSDVFEAYQTVEVEYVGELKGEDNAASN